MSDRYAQLLSNPAAKFFAGRLGLPQPPALARYSPGDPVVPGPVVLGGAPGGRLLDPLNVLLKGLGAEVLEAVSTVEDAPAPHALVFDATGITRSEDLVTLYEFFAPAVRRVRSSGRLIVLGTPPELAGDVRAATAQQALEGFIRSLGKEAKRGRTAQLVWVAPGAEGAIESTVRFLLSYRSAYVSGQVVRVLEPVGPLRVPDDWARPLAGQVAVVTGAARGIGAAIAATLARDGARVVCADIPAQGEQLQRTANDLGGVALQLDVTAADAPARLASFLNERFGGVDIVVHNAGITRDRTIGRMKRDDWDAVLRVNLTSQERIDDVLLGEKVLNPGGRLVGVSSINGLAGQAGQTNYATSKAGVAGRVAALASDLAGYPATANAVAPGFIDTQMTAAVPFAIREVGQRLNSMLQAGQPIDVAETVAWLAAPASAGVSGTVVRVCGQSLLGA